MKKQNNKTIYHKDGNCFEYGLKQARLRARSGVVPPIILIVLSIPVLAILYPLKIITSLFRLIEKGVDFVCEAVISFCGDLSVVLGGLLILNDYVDMANENREQKATMDKILAENKKLKSQLDKAIHNEQNKQR